MFDFSTGLNSKFDAVRGHILGQRPTLTLMEVFSEVRLEEDRSSAMNIITASATDSAAFNAKLSSSDEDKQNEKKPPICEHCKKPWHTKELC